ncbi:hypothetical protein JNB89_30490 [Paraburkholderia phenoliruptrix]|nr:hypothetical protein [Paraburkholderia phenoliruptrix]MBW9133368.1 hypothetical protein [Paraburkholderia ginsengiterrae]
MKIDSALPSTPQAVSRASSNASSSVSADASAASRGIASNAPSQDDAVHISSQGAAAAAQEVTGSEGAVDGASASAADMAAEGNGAASDSSAVKSFAYGTLGLERPDQPHEARNAFYTAGRWLAAGITLGGIISLLI